LRRIRTWSALWLGLAVLQTCPYESACADEQVQARGVIVDALQAPVPGAAVFLVSAQGAVLRTSRSGDDGSFEVAVPAVGSHRLRVSARGFESVEALLDRTRLGSLQIVLAPARVSTEVTVTASRGLIEEPGRSPHVVTVRQLERTNGAPLPTVGQAMADGPGILVQQSTPGQVSPFLRGLTGNQVLHLVDGVRFNNSTYRFGPNQYLALLEPSQVERVEAMLGPAGTQYGSDALGGTINVVTAQPDYSLDPGAAVHGELSAFGAGADLSGGVAAKLAMAGRNVFWVVGAAGRKHNELRAGYGLDSRNVFRRYFGLTPSDVRNLTGDRLPGTAFSQSAVNTRLALRLPDSQSLSLWYQRSGQDGVRGYKDLLGGLGNLQASFEPQGLDFFYARYEKNGVALFDSLSGTFSINSQRDGFVRQGLRATNPVTRDRTRVDAYGYSLQATSHFRRQAVVFGSDTYQERIGSSRMEWNPAFGQSTERRAVYPNGSRYLTTGFFAQDIIELIPGRVRAVAGGRLTHVGFRTFAGRNLDSLGNPLEVADSSQGFRDVTFHGSLSWQVTSTLGWHLLAGRGFRAPNLNDLGAVGLNDLGYEIPASEVESFGALVGNSSGEGAIPTGQPVHGLASERLLDYETGLSWQVGRSSFRVQAFDAELYDPIVRRTLLFHADAAPASIGGVLVEPLPPTEAQRQHGVVTVATTLDRRAVKAFVNDGRQRYWGFESMGRWRVSSAWSVDAQYSFLVGRELDPNRPVRRLPPQHGSVSVRYTPGAGRFWLETGVYAAGAQQRLSGGDIGDERIGAQRSRRDIADFFRGARVASYLGTGADGRWGTGDDLFTPSGQSLLEIQDRVLPLGAVIHGVLVADDNTRVPLFLDTAGYLATDLSGGFRLSETMSLSAGLSNLLDRNYRVHGSGVDAAGRNLWVRYRLMF
jgi:outer membrane receptor protein involved in Fe transport